MMQGARFEAWKSELGILLIAIIFASGKPLDCSQIIVREIRP
jgi:hypothetical protein